MRKTLILAVALAGTAAATATARTPPTPAGTSAWQFLSGYDAASPAVQNELRAFLGSSAMGMDAANLALAGQQMPLLYCLPTSAPVTEWQALFLLRREVANSPSFGDLPWAADLLVALHRTYPCAAAAPRTRS